MSQYNQQGLLKYLQEVQIPFDLYNHAAVATCADVKLLEQKIPGTDTKHLFIENKSGELFAVMTTHHKRVDLNALKIITGTRVSFANAECLKECFGVNPGAVSLLAAINDKHKKVRLIADLDLIAADYLQQHPLENTATVVLSNQDFKKFFHDIGRKLEWAPIPSKHNSQE